jgi:hypothetical protein
MLNISTVLEYWSVLKYYITGSVLEYYSAGIMGYYSTSVEESWYTKHYSTGDMMYYSTTVLESWYTRAIQYWSHGTLEYYTAGYLVY